MKIRVGISIVFICYLTTLFGQDKTPNVWNFGERVELDLNSGQPFVNIGSSGGWYSTEGCTSVADSLSGQLLFYSSGNWVFDRTHQKMPSDTVLLLGNMYSTQSSIALKKPGSNYLWYLFTANWQGGAISYCMIDMSQRGGLGDLVQLPQQLIASADEKLTAVKMPNGSGYWLAIHGFDSNIYYVYPITQNGIGAPVISAVGTSSAPRSSVSNEAKGYMKFSPDKTKIGIAVNYSVNIIEVLNFNDTTGIISGPIFTDSVLPNYGYYKSSPYGVSFSPDSKLFYITMMIDSQFVNRVRLYQYDLSSGDADTILASRYLVGRVGKFFGGIQLASNGKMYVATEDTVLQCVNYPNVYGPGCDLHINAVSLNSHYAGSGLPNVPEDLFANNSLGPLGVYLVDTGYQCGDNCIGEISAITLRGNPPYHFQWNNGDTVASIHNLCAGTYRVTVTDSYGQSLIDSAVIYGSSFDSIFATPEVFCTDDSTRICAVADHSLYQWSTGDTNACIYTSMPGLYNVIITNRHGCSDRLYIRVANFPPNNISVQLNNDTIRVLNGRSNYQWYHNGQIIVGDTTSFLITQGSGNYSVSLNDSFGCAFHSGIYEIIDDIAPIYGLSAGYIYPNPLYQGDLHVSLPGNKGNCLFRLSDMNGNILLDQWLINEQQDLPLNVSPGVYFVRITKGNVDLYFKLVKLE